MRGELVPEQQVASMLSLCEAQMDSALQESDRAVDTLIQAFTSLVDSTRGVGTLTQNLPAEIKSAVTEDLEAQVAAISKQMASAVIAFQFYDKLTQRLGHVRHSLSSLALFVGDPAQTQQPEQWRRLHTTLRSQYRTDEEREIFRMMMDRDNAAVSNEANFGPPGATSEAKTGDIELF